MVICECVCFNNLYFKILLLGSESTFFVDRSYGPVMDRSIIGHIKCKNVCAQPLVTQSFDLRILSVGA
jgi:hypothetical protein